MASLAVTSTICLYVEIALIVFLYPRNSSAQADTTERYTTDRYSEIDFSCLVGDIGQDCAEGSGRERFSSRNASMLSCKTVEEFFGSDEPDPYTVREARMKRSENKIFACASYFEWELHTDTHPRVHTFEEIHGCLYDTRKNLKEAIEGASSDGCIKSTGKWQTLKINQKKCLCYKGHSCNSKFERGFKDEPSAVNSLCRQKEMKDEKDNDETTPSGAKTNSTCLTIMFCFLSLFWMF